MLALAGTTKERAVGSKSHQRRIMAYPVAESIKELKHLSSTLTEVDDELTIVAASVPKKEARVLQAARHALKNAHFIVAGVAWMLENGPK